MLLQCRILTNFNYIIEFKIIVTSILLVMFITTIMFIIFNDIISTLFKLILLRIKMIVLYIIILLRNYEL